MRFWTNARNALKGAVCLALMLFASGGRAWAQDEQPQGVDSGNYNIKQSAEFGYRFTTLTGNQDTYKTFVNLEQGPRLMDYTFEMRSLNHQGWLFDRLYFSNFGYGGDPNNVSRLRAYKNKWYDFSATFRRDRNVWDYSLLANPLNPVPSTFAITPPNFTPLVSISPHLFDTTRRMSDYNLILRPQDKIRVRLGYSRNIAQGPSFSSIHQGTEALLLQLFKTTVNTFQLGVDFKFIPRTNISYDQYWRYYKGDTTYQDGNLLFPLANGTNVDLGIPFNAAGGQPCAAPFVTFTPPVGPSQVVANPTCNLYLSDSRQGRARTSFPTEQLSFQSNYFKKLDLSGRFMYTGADMNVLDFGEVFSGRESRTNLRDHTASGPVKGRNDSASLDAGMTWHVTEKFRISDTFRFSNFKIPAQWSYTQCNFSGTRVLTGTTITGSTAFVPSAATLALLPATCANPPLSTTGTPPHSSSSPPDISVGVSSKFLKQDLKNNLFEVEYEFTPRVGARLGYRFRHRTIADSDVESGTFVFFPSTQNARTGPSPWFNTLTCPAASNLADGTCILTPPTLVDNGNRIAPIEINENSALFGLWARPIDKWRVNFDMELMSADNSFTRISPRQLQQYRLRSTYKPLNWISIGASFNILENRDNVPQIDNLQHNRSYGASVVLEPNDKFSFDAGYDYNDVFSQINICYTLTPSPAGLSKCPSTTTLIENLSTYTSKTHFVYFNVMWRPIHRIVTHLGDTVVNTNGNALLINPNQPSGTLNYNYHRPTAGFEVSLIKGLSWKTDWGYYSYQEKDSSVPIDMLAPRDFRGNIVTLSMRYAF